MDDYNAKFTPELKAELNEGMPQVDNDEEEYWMERKWEEQREQERMEEEYGE